MTPSPTETEPLPDAASVLLLRPATGEPAATGESAAGDEPASLEQAPPEVFVVERQKAGAFAGVLAFPGGKVDPSDRSLPRPRWSGIDLAEVATRWGMDPDAEADRVRLLGWHVAAVREAFEEVGVLLAHHADDGRPVSARDLGTTSFLEARAALVERGVPWDWTGWLAQHDLVLDLGALGAWSRWITPEGEPRRFDTAFFLATVPDAQRDALAHDEVEVVASRWRTVEAILEERAAGTSVVIYPTRRQLTALPATFAEAFAAAAKVSMAPVQPKITIEEDGSILAHHPTDGTVESVF